MYFCTHLVKYRVLRVALVNRIFRLHNLATQDVYLRSEFVVSCAAFRFALFLQLRNPLLYFRYSFALLCRISLPLFVVNAHVLLAPPHI